MTLSRRLTSFFFPRRAPVQTWMLLTFALFVGVVVAGVGLYTTFVLHEQAEAGKRDMLVSQARNVALAVAQADGAAARRRVVEDAARLLNLRVSVGRDGALLADAGATTGPGSDGIPAGAGELPPLTLEPEQVHLFERTYAAGRRISYVQVWTPDDAFVVRIGQDEPLIFDVIRRMLTTLVFGMTLALVLSAVGAWIAARQVTGPLRAIRNTARSIAEGEYDAKIVVTSRAAEFQDLAKSLNRMSDSFIDKITELERLAQMQSEFIGNVSHEVRNPIFTIGGYLEALSMKGLTDEQRQRYAEKGLTNLQRLNNLFNDLIEMAKLEYREDLLRNTVFDLSELLEEVVEMLRPKAEEKGLRLVVENPPSWVQADRNRIRQVLVNLVENAIAYSDEGSVRVRFHQRKEKVRVEVIDTGKGIPEEHLERIFERFHRVDPDRSRKSGGTGLGLSIVKQILQAHGESVHVESTLGRGTRFWFELPRAEAVVEIEHILD